MGGIKKGEGGRMEQWGLPVGFRFAPTDEELVTLYLKGKIGGGTAGDGLIAEFDVYGCNPWELPRHMFGYPRGQQEEMYFFSSRRSAKGNGGGKRCGRTAGCGVWHGNGKDNHVRGWDEDTGRSADVGHKTSFKFEMMAPSSSSNKKKRIKTNWLMHEYTVGSRGGGGDLALCKIYELRRAASQEDDDDKGPQGHLKRGRGLAVPVGEPQPHEAAGQQTDTIDEGARLDPAKRRRVDQPEPPASMAFDDNPVVLDGNAADVLSGSRCVGGNPVPMQPSSSINDALPVAEYDIVALPSLPPPSWPSPALPDPDQEDWDPMLCIDFDYFDPASLSDAFTLENIDALPILPPVPSHDPLEDIHAWAAGDVLALREPPPTSDAPPGSPGLPPSPPLDAVALPSPPPSMAGDVPARHWPGIAHHCHPFEQTDTSPLLHQHNVHSMAPSPIYYRF